MAEQSAQEQVIELVKSGEHTRKEIVEKVGCTAGSMASYLSTMMNIAKFTDADMAPMTDEDGKMFVGSYADYTAAKAAKTSTKKTSAKTPEERLEAAEKRLTRCTNAQASAAKRYEADADSRVLELRSQLADINLELAEIELDSAKELVESAPENTDIEESTEDDLL